MSAALAEGFLRISHNLCKRILHTSLHSAVWGWGWGGLLSLRSHSLSGGLDVPVAMAQTGSRKQQGELPPGQGDRRRSEGSNHVFMLTMVCSSRPLSQEAPEMMNLGRKWSQWLTHRLGLQSWKGPQEEICLSVHRGPQTQSRAGETQHLGEDAGISGLAWRV